jgi:hypothetical protein
MTLKTFDDVKRAITVGTELDMIYYRPTWMPTPNLPMHRKVLFVQSNGIAMTAWPGHAGPSWLHWGKSSECRIDGPDTFSIIDTTAGEVIATYRIV